MTALQWDQVGDRRFETGIDRGVLFLSDGRAIAWNGLTGIEDSTTRELQAHYLDGVKFLEREIIGDYSAKLKAFSYPEEFNEVLGVKQVHEGLYYHDQPSERFNLCYRTLVGNDIDGTDHGYRIHILYNVMAIPDAQSFSTLGESAQVTEFSWTLSGIPPATPGYRPTMHISIDSTQTDLPRLQDIEEMLYGTDSADPELPPLSEFTDFFDQFNNLYITDNGDGTWTATDAGEDFITMIDATTFVIDNANATYLDAVTYEISTTITD
jgi:hypothetical protein